MTRKFLLTILFLTAAPVWMRAAEPARSRASSGRMGINDAIADALGNNSELQVFEASVAASKGGVTTAKTFANPELSIAPGVKRVREGGTSTSQFHGNIGFNQLFKFPGKRALEIAIAERNVELQQLALEGFRFQLSAKVRKAFYEMLAAQKIIGLRKEQVGSAKTFVESARKRAESGYASDFDKAARLMAVSDTTISTAPNVQTIAAPEGRSK